MHTYLHNGFDGEKLLISPKRFVQAAKVHQEGPNSKKQRNNVDHRKPRENIEKDLNMRERCENEKQNCILRKRVFPHLPGLFLAGQPTPFLEEQTTIQWT